MTITSKLPTQTLANPAPVSEILKDYFEGMYIETIASILGVGVKMAEHVMNNTCAPNTTMCLRLAYYFDTSFEYWMGMSNSYTLYRLAQNEEEIRQSINKLKKDKPNETGRMQ